MMAAEAELTAAWTGLPAGLMAAIGAVVALNFCWMMDCALAS